MKKHGTCSKCKTGTTAQLVTHIRRNYAIDFMWVCDVCGTRNPFGGPLFIAKEKVESHLTQDEIDKLPVEMPEAENRCVRCGGRDCEMHHWAPRALFQDKCEDWPKDFLCKDCHDEWHHSVTPQLVK